MDGLPGGVLPGFVACGFAAGALGALVLGAVCPFVAELCCPRTLPLQNKARANAAGTAICNFRMISIVTLLRLFRKSVPASN